MIAWLYILFISLCILGALSWLLPKQLSHLISKREFAAAIYLPTACVFSPNFVILCLLIVGFMAFIPATHEQRLRLLVFSLHLVPTFAFMIPAPPGIEYLFTVNFYLLLSVGCVGLIAAAPRDTNAKLRQWDLLAAMLIGALLLASIKDASLTHGMRVITELYLVLGIPYLVVSRGFTLVRRPTDLFLAIIFGACILAAITVFESQRSWLLYEAIENSYGAYGGTSGYAKQRGGYLRASATFPESTSLSLFLGLVTVMVVALRKKFVRPSLFYFVLGIVVAGLVFTFARVGLLVAAIGFAALLLHMRRFGMLAAVAIGAPILLVGVQVAAPYVPVLAAALGETGDAEGTLNYRDRLANRMLEEISNKPFFGLTQGEVRTRLADMRQGEGIIDLVNTPLAVAMQSGLIGLAMFLAPPFALLFALYHTRRMNDPDEALAGRAIFACLFALQVGLITTSLQPPTRLWVMLLLALGAGLYAVRRRAKPREERSPTYREPAVAMDPAE